MDTDAPPSGPLSGPSKTTWRRKRLLTIGAAPVDVVATPSAFEHTALADAAEGTASYGTLPPRPVPTRTESFRKKHSLPALPGLHIGRNNSGRSGKASASNPPSPHTPGSAIDFQSIFNTLRQNQRPISAYDRPLLESKPDTSSNASVAGEPDAKTNGIRVWYSSYTSIDWLHDAIKDSVRRSRMLKRKSVKGRVRRQGDRLLGWVLVTVVGFLTAIVAYGVVKSEKLLFDWKEGYCGGGMWWKDKSACCPQSDEEVNGGFGGMLPWGKGREVVAFGLTSGGEGVCVAWRTWSDVFGEGKSVFGLEPEMIEYASYTCVALLLALVSSLLTIYLTASNSFVTRKDSGVLSPDFASLSSSSAPSSTSKAFPPIITAAQSSSPTPGPVQPKRKVLYYAAGSGIPEIKTILSGFVIHGYLGGRTLFTKAVGLALSVASGLSLGKEGPFVHIGCCVGNICSRFFGKYESNEGKRREILSAASAAGVAVAFGAPIGGTLFSLEEVSYFFPPKVMWRSFFCAMIAAVTLKFLNPFGTGKLVLFQVTYDKDWHAYELVFFVILGVFGGVYGAYFSKLNYRWSRHVRNGTWLGTHPISEVLLVTLVTALLSFLNPYTRMGGTELVYNLFAECRVGSPNTHEGLCVLDPPTQAYSVMKAIFTALIVKGALTIVTFGIKVPAGIFIPTLGVGACAGRILGIGVQWLQWHYPGWSGWWGACGGDRDCVIPGLYAMVGAAATLAGATRTTVSLAVIMFELTDTLTYAVPVMLAVLVAKTVADAIEPKGIYDLVIELSQLPYLDAKHDPLWGDLEISDVTNRDVEVIYVDKQNTVRTLRDQLQELVFAGYEDGGFPILRKVGTGDGVGEGLRMIGYIGASELEHALSIVADAASSPVQFHTAQTHFRGDLASSSVSFNDLLEASQAMDPLDFSVYMDQAPLTVQSNSPLALVHEFFVKLGAKYVVVTDTDGLYEGVIDKKAWLAFLDELEHKH
ncbi:hypothetical protein JAAARDRAFT_130295 [Jaapia argillacea MUCL 33604]|uniref:Uncharacterized protein n=1 Tax=Jaapia argillacea MUCL 33604 TaxID=933084 RepID=A0A067PUF3_9AGAM|nr:hypothetical protein JAAARDRAFT_130295 [Jaapia argillacea MUCL 33604]